MVWLLFAAAIFCLQPRWPVTAANLNFAIIAVGGAVVLVTSAWVLSAHSWFTGPRIDVDNSDAVKTKYWITDPPKTGLQNLVNGATTPAQYNEAVALTVR